MEQEVLLEVKNLKEYFPVSGKKVVAKAVDDVSFKIYKGETLGLVGESGCGKSTTGKAILKLIEPTGGQIIYKGTDITKYKESKMRPLRSKLQMVFQDPYGCLNPRKTVFDIIAAPLRLQGIKDKVELKKRVLSLMEEVGLRPDQADRLPHEFSGGQRQRIGIARALACDPDFIVCDEPVSALDVSVQAQVINLIHDLQKERDLTLLFISHDLRVVKHLCDRIAVMYLGSIAEEGSKKAVTEHPAHPYTQALLSAVPEVGAGRLERMILQGDLPSPINPPSGCRFHTRCPYAKDICSKEVPEGKDLGDGHICYCHFPLPKDLLKEQEEREKQWRAEKEAEKNA